MPAGPSPTTAFKASRAAAGRSIPNGTSRSSNRKPPSFVRRQQNTPSSPEIPSLRSPSARSHHVRYASRSAWTSAFQTVSPFRRSQDTNSVPIEFPPSSSSSNPSNNLGSIVDPLKLVGKELGALRNNVKQLLGSGHPALDTISKYYFQAEGKHVRPLIVLLMSQATNGLSPDFERIRLEAEEREVSGRGGVDDPLSPSSVLEDVNPDLANTNRPDYTLSSSPSSSSPPTSTILSTQRRLAEITEMIHVASLLHDDVIDNAELRRSAPSSPSLFGNKLSILAGDFLLARASLALSRLGSNEVVELVASVLANLVEGEVMQMKGNTPFATSMRRGGKLTPEIFEHYMRKTYLKTASLIAKSSRATTILAGCGKGQGWEAGERVKDVAYAFGRHLGLAFQLIDDNLDFTASASSLGKPSDGADLKLGLATAPALFAWEEYPEMGEMIERKFEGQGDVERARQLISKSSGTARTAALAAEHAALAKRTLDELPESDARTALENLTDGVLSRSR